MISSVLGSVIISMATVSLLLAIQLSEQALEKAGRYPLTSEEIKIVLNIPSYNSNDISDLQLDVQSLTPPKE